MAHHLEHPRNASACRYGRNSTRRTLSCRNALESNETHISSILTEVRHKRDNRTMNKTNIYSPRYDISVLWPAMYIIYMYECIYICCMYVYIYLYIYVYMCIHKVMYTHKYVYIYATTNLYILKWVPKCGLHKQCDKGPERAAWPPSGRARDAYQTVRYWSHPHHRWDRTPPHLLSFPPQSDSLLFFPRILLDCEILHLIFYNNGNHLYMGVSHGNERRRICKCTRSHVGTIHASQNKNFGVWQTATDHTSVASCSVEWVMSRVKRVKFKKSTHVHTHTHTHNASCLA